jgi:transposase
MIVPDQRLPIVIATKPVDFRRGHDGLAATVQDELGLDPHSGLTVVFRSKRGDRSKILVWDGTGLIMVYKRLDEGTFAWPAVTDGVIRIGQASMRGAVLRIGLASDDSAAGAGAGCGELNHLGFRAPHSFGHDCLVG